MGPGAEEEKLRRVGPARWSEKGRKPRVWAAPERCWNGVSSGGSGAGIPGDELAWSSGEREVSAWGTQGWTRRVRWWDIRAAMLLRAANAMAGLMVRGVAARSGRSWRGSA